MMLYEFILYPHLIELQMKKTLLLYLFLLNFILVKAQVTYEPSPIVIEGDVQKTDLVAEINISQNLADSTILYWSLEKTNFPSKWESLVCDQFTCYGPNKDLSSVKHGNKMYKDSVYHWSIHINPNNVIGVDTIILNLFDDKDRTNKVVSIPVSINIVMGTNTIDRVKSSPNIQLFPNPTVDYFEVLNDEGVDKIVIYNVVGKIMKSSIHIEGQSHDVSSLQRGLYIVRLLDYNDELLKVIRITKK